MCMYIHKRDIYFLLYILFLLKRKEKKGKQVSHDILEIMRISVILHLRIKE